MRERERVPVGEELRCGAIGIWSSLPLGDTDLAEAKALNGERVRLTGHGRRRPGEVDPFWEPE